jgi:hypothetical protein
MSAGVKYFLGVLFAVLAGLINFFGQLLQKKSINEVKAEKGTPSVAMGDLLKKPLWWTGLVSTLVFNSVMLAVAQISSGRR